MAKATREAYGQALKELIVKNDKVIVLDADLTKSTKTADAKAVCPERHFNVGIAEANMIGIAAGFATSGYTVFASSFAMFASGRAWEQIRNTLCYPGLNVKVCGTHAGITVGEDGASHQAIEDIAIMRAIPKMEVYQPCDQYETKAIIDYVATTTTPCYVRLGRGGVADVYDENTTFDIHKVSVLNQGKDIAIIATGMMVQESLKAVELLKEKGINPTVVNVRSIKPLDEAGIIEILKSHNHIITAEEHSVIGGLGGAIAEVAVKHHPARIDMIGMQDVFGESGKASDLVVKYGLTAEAVAEKVLEASK
ncbi:MAG: transketolase family protein [Erysipelotrichaceae bacterium]